MNTLKKFCNQNCKQMHEIGVPLDKPEWLELAYIMRTISNFMSFTEGEKKTVQGQLIKAFKNKEFIPEKYKNIISEIEKTSHSGCQEKLDGLEEIIGSMSKLITGMSKEVGDLTNKQAGNMSNMNKTADQIILNIKTKISQEKTLQLVEMLKKDCKKALKNVADIQHTLKKEAMFDPLTKLYNRRVFDKQIRNAVNRFQKKKIPVSLILIDVDYFKKVNDQFGHLIGDKVLTAVSDEIRQNIRNLDIAARYGGEEIAVLFDNLNLEFAKTRANIIRKSIASHEFIIRNTKEKIGITVSIGVAQLIPKWLNLSTEEIVTKFISETDAALYKAKESGRNKVCLYDYHNCN